MLQALRKATILGWLGVGGRETCASKLESTPQDEQYGVHFEARPAPATSSSDCLAEEESE